MIPPQIRFLNLRRSARSPSLCNKFSRRKYSPMSNIRCPRPMISFICLRHNNDHDRTNRPLSQAYNSDNEKRSSISSSAISIISSHWRPKMSSLDLWWRSSLFHKTYPSEAPLNCNNPKYVVSSFFPCISSDLLTQKPKGKLSTNFKIDIIALLHLNSAQHPAMEIHVA